MAKKTTAKKTTPKKVEEKVEEVKGQLSPEVKDSIAEMEKEFEARLAAKKEGFVENLPEGVEFKQIGKKSYLIHANKRISRHGELEDNKDILARIFLLGK